MSLGRVRFFFIVAPGFLKGKGEEEGEGEGCGGCGGVELSHFFFVFFGVLGDS